MGKLINYLENEMKAQELFEKAKKIAYEKQVPTDDILNPMLIEHGFEDGNGIALETYCLTLLMMKPRIKYQKKNG